MPWPTVSNKTAEFDFTLIFFQFETFFRTFSTKICKKNMLKISVIFRFLKIKYAKSFSVNCF